MSPDLWTSRITDLNRRAISLTIGTHSSDIINWGYIGPEYWRNYLHTHSFHEVCYAFAGKGSFRIHGRHYDVETGDLFVAKPGEPHEIVSSCDQPLGIYFWAFTLLPPEDGAPAEMGADALLTAYRTSSRWVSRRVPTISATLDLLEDEVERNAPGNTEAIEGLVVKLLLDTCRSVVDRPIPSEDAPPLHHAPAEQIADRIARYLQDNYAGSVTVRDVAAQVHLSERHTNRLFRTMRGQTILQALTALRMDRAQRLLLDPELSIKEVAHAVGYADIHYFTTLFHRHSGMPPATFRRKNGTRVLERP
jgi:AraC-like DNA-binding protein